MFGKWHLGHYSNVHPNQRGFDEYLGFPQGHIERYFHPDQLNHNGRPVEARGHVSEVFTDSAVSFVKANRARPFFLYLAFNVPHEPSFVDDSYTQRFLDKGVPLRDAKVYGMIRHCDEQIGRLLKTVDEAGLREDTIVIFLTDNGGVSRHFRAGLRGNKATAYEGGVRVPFFARWPGRFPAGAVVEAAAAHIDVLPTLCELTGAPLPERKLDGKSIARLMREGRGEPPHDFLYHIWDRHRPGMRSNWSIHGRRFKLVKNELFDLRADPGEKTDLAAKHPEEAAALRREFERWLKEVTAGRVFEPVAVEIGAPGDPHVDLEASWAQVPEGVNYTFTGYDWDSIDGWRKPGDWAGWKLDVVVAGRYRVELSYGCSPEDAGGRYRIDLGGERIEGRVESTSNRNVFEWRAAGEVTLGRGPVALRVVVADAPGRDLMTLNKVRLTKAG